MAATSSLVIGVATLLLFTGVIRSDDGPDIAECSAQLLLLAPCAPFVQGSTGEPMKACCDNLVDLYAQKPACLCLMVKEKSLPINRTLTLHLPRLCDLKIDPSNACGGTINFLPSYPASSSTSVVAGKNSTPTKADTPPATVSPSVAVLNSGKEMKPNGKLIMLIITADVYFSRKLRFGFGEANDFSS